jgi:hypothetical protein
MIRFNKAKVGVFEEYIAETTKQSTEEVFIFEVYPKIYKHEERRLFIIFKMMLLIIPSNQRT